MKALSKPQLHHSEIPLADKVMISKWLVDVTIPQPIRIELLSLKFAKIEAEKTALRAEVEKAKLEAMLKTEAKKATIKAAKARLEATLKAEAEKAKLRSEKNSLEGLLVAEKFSAKFNVEIAQAVKAKVKENHELEVASLQSAILTLMDEIATLNPRAVLDNMENVHMPLEYKNKKLSRKDRWTKFLEEDKGGQGLFECLKRIPDWDSPTKCANHFSNIYSLASQYNAHSTSSSIAASSPKTPIRLTGALLPQTISAMMCIGKHFKLEFASPVE